MDMINKMISIKELNSLAVSYVSINQSYNDKIVELGMKKLERKVSKTSIKDSILNEWQEVKGRKAVKNMSVVKIEESYSYYYRESEDRDNNKVIKNNAKLDE